MKHENYRKSIWLIQNNEEEKQWLAKQNFQNTADDAYTG